MTSLRSYFGKRSFIRLTTSLISYFRRLCLILLTPTLVTYFRRLSFIWLTPSLISYFGRLLGFIWLMPRLPSYCGKLSFIWFTLRSTILQLYCDGMFLSDEKRRVPGETHSQCLLSHLITYP